MPRPMSQMTNLKKIKPAFLALMIALIASVPAAAQEGMNPLIPGGNSAPPGRAPKAVVSNPLYDFGTALEGTMVSHTFTIKNNGQGYLDIRGVKTSCGCTTGKSLEDAYRAGRRERNRRLVRHALSEGSPGAHHHRVHQRSRQSAGHDDDAGDRQEAGRGAAGRNLIWQREEGNRRHQGGGGQRSQSGARAVPGRSGEQLEFFDQGRAGKASRRQAGRAAQSLAAQDDADGAVRRHDQDHDQSRAVAG